MTAYGAIVAHPQPGLPFPREEPCGHRHRVLQAAKDCAVRLPGFAYPRVIGTEVRVVDMETGSVLFLERVNPPPEFWDEAGSEKGVAWTWRKWREPRPYGKTGKVYHDEATFTAGALSLRLYWPYKPGAETWRHDLHHGERVAGMASLLALLVSLDPERAEKILTDARTEAPEELEEVSAEIVRLEPPGPTHKIRAGEVVVFRPRARP